MLNGDNKMRQDKPMTPDEVLDKNDLTGGLYTRDADLNVRDREDIIYAMDVYKDEYIYKLSIYNQ
jgi:hypothetical protein